MRYQRPTPRTGTDPVFADVPVVDDLTLPETLDSLMVAALRQAARRPKPSRDLAREILCALPADSFEPWIAQRYN